MKMQRDIFLLTERLVAAIEGINGNVDRISISLNDINSNLSYIVAEKRRTKVRDATCVSSNIEHTNKVATDPPPASSFDEQPVYIGSVSSRLIGDEGENFVTGEDEELKDQRCVPVTDTMPINTLGLFQLSIKEEPVDFGEDLERPCENTDLAMVAHEYTCADTLDNNPPNIENPHEMVQQIQQEQIPEEYVQETSYVQPESYVMNVSHSTNISGCSHNYGDLSKARSVQKRSNEQPLEETRRLTMSSKRESTHKEADEELPGVFPCFVVEQLKTEIDNECATGESARGQMERMHDSECRDLRQEDRQRSISQRDYSMQNISQVKSKKSFCCQMCKRCFGSGSLLERHIRVHTGEKPFSCSLCGKLFSQKNNLVSHMLIHTGERPFKCSICEKTFNHSSHLSRHMRQHTGVKPYKCSACKKAFTVKSNLITHMRTHSGERPYACATCGMRFRQVSALTYHTNRLHPVTLACPNPGGVI